MSNLAVRIIKDNRGLTLVEMAVVLVIVGMLAGLGAGMIGPLTKRAKVHETKDTLQGAVDSLINYAASANALPDASTFPTLLRKSEDSWQKEIKYIFDDDLTDATFGGICGRSSTQLDVNLCFSTGCGSPTTSNNVAFIVLSSAGNFNNQTERSRTVTNPVTINVYDFGLNVDNESGGGDPSRAEPYDDIVQWMTLDELRVKAGCSGPPLKILNSDLPSGKVSNVYSASVYADSGVPFSDGPDTGSDLDYEWCWEDDSVKGTPAGMNFDCRIALASSATCGLSSGTWRQCTSVDLSGTPAASDNYKLTFFVRDDNDNISERTVVLTVNP